MLTNCSGTRLADIARPFRFIAIFGILGYALPESALAWEFTPGQPCLLEHSQGDTAITLTYDPTQPLYSVTVTRPAPWPQSPYFAMRFEGPNPISIATPLHQLSADGRTVTVTDSGFGNVLDGLQFNDIATIAMEGVMLTVSLDGAAPEVAAFRACETAVPSV